MALVECGRFSPGIVLIRSNPMSGTLNQFLHYLDNHISINSLSNMNIYILIRSFWALPRVGCTYTKNGTTRADALQGSNNLIHVLLSKILESRANLSSMEWSIVIKAIGKLHYFGDSAMNDCILSTSLSFTQLCVDGVMQCCSSFTLSEISDIAWGLLRMRIETNQFYRSSCSHLHTMSKADSQACEQELQSGENGDFQTAKEMDFLSDNRMYSILQQIETLVKTTPSSLKHLRP